MVNHTRRQFLQSSAAAVVAAAVYGHSAAAFASPLGLPLGLQLYSVREQLPQDYEGTLKKVASLGYKEVEAAGFYNHTATEVKADMAAAGLNCVSAHYPWSQLSTKLDEILAFHKVLGAHYIICAYPGHVDASNTSHDFSLEDWRWNAKNFNTVGAKVKAAGFQFGYHNHTMEFVKQGDVVPFDELLRLTDPALVTFEMDCGWVTVGGGDPVMYLHKYADRISMLHVKDFKSKPTTPGQPPEAAELGRGIADYHAIFAAAQKGKIKHYFVEQEHFDIPPFEALKIDADYMKALNV